MTQQGRWMPDVGVEGGTDMDELQERTRVWLGLALGETLPASKGLARLLADGHILLRLGQQITALYKEKFGELLGGEGFETALLAHDHGTTNANSSARLLRRNASWSTKGHWDAIAHVAGFLKVCLALGLQDVHMFVPTDVVEQRNLKTVCVCIRVLSLKLNSLGLVAAEFEPQSGTPSHSHYHPPMGKSQSHSAAASGHVESVVRIMDMGLSAYPNIRAKVSGNSSEEDVEEDEEYVGSYDNSKVSGSRGREAGRRAARSGRSVQEGHPKVAPESSQEGAEGGWSSAPHVLSESNSAAIQGSSAKQQKPEGEALRQTRGESTPSKKLRRRRSLSVENLDSLNRRSSSGHKENGHTAASGELGGIPPEPQSGAAKAVEQTPREFRLLRVNAVDGALEPLEGAKAPPGLWPFVLSANLTPAGADRASQVGGEVTELEPGRIPGERSRRPRTAGAKVKAAAAAAAETGRQGRGGHGEMAEKEIGKVAGQHRKSLGGGKKGKGGAVSKKRPDSWLDLVAQLPMHVVVGGAVAATVVLGALAMAVLKPKRKYKVKQGDCLIQIAQKTGTKDWKDIQKQNPKIRDPNLIISEDIIKV